MSYYKISKIWSLEAAIVGFSFPRATLSRWSNFGAIRYFHSIKYILNMSSANWLPFCVGLEVLLGINHVIIHTWDYHTYVSMELRPAPTNPIHIFPSIRQLMPQCTLVNVYIYILRCHILAIYMPSTKDESTMCTLGRIHLFQCLQTPKISQLIILDVHGTGFVIQTNHYDVTGEFPSQRPVTRSFDVFFDLCMNVNDWVNHCEAGDLKRHRAHCYVTLMLNPYVDVLYLRDQSVYNSNPSTFRISSIHSCR